MFSILLLSRPVDTTGEFRYCFLMQIAQVGTVLDLRRDNYFGRKGNGDVNS